jgi:hypothetical protein
VITSTTDVYVYYGEHPTNSKQMAVKITSTQPLTISMIFDDSFGFNGDDAVYYLPDGDATGGSAGFIPCIGESTGDATVVHVASGSGTLTDPYVFGSGPSASSGPEVAWDKTTKTGTFTMPAGDVELQVEYYPGMLVKPTNLVGGTMEIKGVTDTTLPEGFEKDAEGNIYVAKDTKFTVKAVPAEGYHLVGWSDDATNKELEREFTMTDDDFTVTATFSDEYTLAFQAANALTIESGKATVKVGDAAATVSEGKIQGVKYGQTVTLTAATGYKFRTVEVKKKSAYEHSITIAVDPSTNEQKATAPAMTIEFKTGETWADVAARYDWLDTYETYTVFYKDDKLMGDVHDANGGVKPNQTIDPNGSYHWGM